MVVSSDYSLESWFTAQVPLVAPGRCVGTAENLVSVLIFIVKSGRTSTRGVVDGPAPRPTAVCGDLTLHGRLRGGQKSLMKSSDI